MAITQITVAELLNSQQLQLTRIEQLLSGQKSTLTLEETARYMGLSKSYLYKLTAAGAISFYKPEGKLIYFDRVEVDTWLKRNRVKPAEEIEAETSTYVTARKAGRGGRTR